MNPSNVATATPTTTITVVDDTPVMMERELEASGVWEEWSPMGVAEAGWGLEGNVQSEQSQAVGLGWGSRTVVVGKGSPVAIGWWLMLSEEAAIVDVIIISVELSETAIVVDATS